MPHRVSTQITIGGLLPASLVSALLAAVEQEGASGSWGGGPLAADADELREIVMEARSPLWVCDDQHLGNFDALEAFCMAHGLTFVSHSEGGDEADAEIRWWRPGLRAVRSESALDSKPALTVSAIQELLDAPSPEEALTQLGRRLAEATPPEVPPLEITGLPERIED